MENTAVQKPRFAFRGTAGWASFAAEGVSIASFAGFSDEGQFLIALDGEPEPIPALSTIGLSWDDAEAKVVVGFEGGDERNPIILGRLRDRPEQTLLRDSKAKRERVVVRADRGIELRCGDASIVLTPAGKVLIKGKFVLSQSSGANKVKGAFVHIN